jgi:hypothetical protein
VSSATGSDANSCEAAALPGTPRKSIRAGIACIVDNAAAGDQLMIAEGTSYADGPGNISYKYGHSPMYPTVIQSYDPADPFNEAKHGRAGEGKRPVLNTQRLQEAHWTSAGNTPNFSHFAIRGLDWNPGNHPNQTILFTGGNNYLLFENNVFRYTGMALNGGHNRKTKHVVRKSTFYGSWSDTGHSGGIYVDGIDGVTIEENVFWHVGWKVGVGRDTPASSGGPTMFRHAVYTQTDTTQVVARRNLFMDSAASGASMRGDVKLFENVFIDNPIGCACGGGDGYDVIRPNGVLIEVADNLFLGDADIDPNNPRGVAVMSANGNSSSYVRNNLILRSRNPFGVNVMPFSNGAHLNKPSYMVYDRNLVYKFSPVISASSAFPSQVLSTFTNNVWDAPTLETNTNNAGLVIPSPVSQTDIWTTLGCSTKDACAARIIENPEKPWAARIRAYVKSAYGQ